MRTKLTVLPPAPERAPLAKPDIRCRVRERQHKITDYSLLLFTVLSLGHWKPGNPGERSASKPFHNMYFVQFAQFDLQPHFSCWRSKLTVTLGQSCGLTGMGDSIPLAGSSCNFI